MPRWRLLAGCAVVVGGCANTPFQAPAGKRYDGRYAGWDRLVSGAVFQCGAPELAQEIEVRDGRFDYPFQVSPPRVAALPVQIAADGTMAGQMRYGTGEEIPGFSRDRIDWVYLRGSISGPTLEARITDLRCARRLTVQRRPG
jgi:hypothetical protein